MTSTTKAVSLIVASALVGCGGQFSLGGATEGAEAGESPTAEAGEIPTAEAGAPDGPVAEADGDASTPFDKSGACAAAPTAAVSYATASDLSALIVGQWVRCEGVLQPAGELPAPDRQDGLEFDRNGTIYGLVSSQLPLPTGGTGYLPYVGAGYGLIEWQFWPSDGGVPGVLFESTSGSSGFSDIPQFSNGGDRMVLSDSVWGGTYVRFSHFSFNP